MISRRNFLQSSLLAGTASTLAASKLLGRSKPAETNALPPAIAALKSMKDLAKPITKDERRARIARATELMQQNKLDAILMSGGTSLVYFSNIKWWLSERFFGMILPAKGRPFYVCPAFERDRAMEQISQGPLDQDPDIRTWRGSQTSSFTRACCISSRAPLDRRSRKSPTEMLSITSASTRTH